MIFLEDTKKEIDKGIFPENAVTEEEQLYGFAPEFTISTGTAMSTNMLKSIDEKVAAMKEPRSVGAGSADLSQIVSGTVRPGDTVEIEECRPLSATKRFRLVRVISKGE